MSAEKRRVILAMRTAMTVLVAGGALTLRAETWEFVLREPLRQSWSNELVHVPFSVPPDSCRVDSVRLTDPDGQPVAVQLSEIEFWPETQYVRTAKLSFLVNLAPLAEDTYTVRYGHQAPTTDGPATELRLQREADHVEVTTGTFGVRLLLGQESYPEPVPAAQVPGPVLAMQRADGTRFGGSAMYGPTGISAYSAEITDAGPVFAQVAIRYTYADGRSMSLTARLITGHPQTVWAMDCPSDLPTDGWRLFLTPGLDPLHFTAIPEFYENRWGTFEMIGGKWVGTNEEVDLTREPPGFLVHMVPWAGWWDSQNKRSFTFHLPERGDVLFFGSRDAGLWKQPDPDSDLASFPYGDATMRKRWVPLIRGEDGSIYFDFNASQGERHWQFGAPFPPDAPPSTLGGMPWPAERYQRLDSLLHAYTLNWPRKPERLHPRMYVSRAELEAARQRPADPAVVEDLIGRAQRRAVPFRGDANALGAYLLTGDPQVAARTEVVERLRHHLELFGAFDLMRSPLVVAALYDAVIDSDLIPPDERPVRQAQMAWLAYRMADPSTWSANRGYCSGNHNMTVAYILQQGQVACLLSDHPKARQWAAPALAMMDKWLNELGPEGEHIESVANYAHVTTSSMLTFAIAAKNAGLRDFVNDPRMKQLMLFLAKQYTPPDPRGGGNRKPGFSRLPAAGRGPAGQRWDLPAAMARATADRDPEYARALQWVWLQAGRPGNADSRLGGFEHVYNDPERPVSIPEWGSDFFPAYGAILRSGLGTPDAYYVNFQAHIGDGRPTADGSFPAIFAKGAMISTVFNEGYIDREELLVSKVLPARDRGTTEARNASFYHKQEDRISAFAALPRQDYLAFDALIKDPVRLAGVNAAAHAKVFVPEAWPPVETVAEKAPISWRRQLLFLKDEDGAGVNYLVLRDTVSGQQPTMWQFWTLSEKIGTADLVRDPEDFLADKPGNSPVEPRELHGNRFTAVGQFGVDLEYYVASPTDTPRHTLRAGVDYAFYDFVNTGDYQDLLHLQRPGDGAYYVVLFPRRRAEPVPEFETLADETIIRVRGEFGADYVFLSDTEAEADAENVRFKGMAGSIQDRDRVRILSLGSPGEIQYRNYGVAAAFPASLRIETEKLTVSFPERLPDFDNPVNPLNAYGWKGRKFFPLTAFPGGTVELRVPGNWEPAQTVEGVQITKTPAGYTLTVSAGVRTVELTAR